MREVALPPFDAALNIATRMRGTTENQQDDPYTRLAKARLTVGTRAGSIATKLLKLDGLDGPDSWMAFQADVTDEELAALHDRYNIPSSAYVSAVWPEEDDPPLRQSLSRGVPAAWRFRSALQVTGVAEGLSLGEHLVTTNPYIDAGLMSLTALAGVWLGIKKCRQAVPLYYQALIARYKALATKITDTEKGSIWLPHESFTVPVTSEGEPQPLFKPEWVDFFGGHSTLLERYIDPFTGRRAENKSWQLFGRSVVVRETKTGRGKNATRIVTECRVNPAQLIEQLVSSSPDSHTLWHEFGLNAVALELSSVCTRLKYAPRLSTAQDEKRLYELTAQAIEAHQAVWSMSIHARDEESAPAQAAADFLQKETVRVGELEASASSAVQ